MSRQIQVYQTFGTALFAFDDRLEELRKEPLVHEGISKYPLSDPHRVSLGGLALAGLDKIEELKVLTFPAVLFESLPIVSSKTNFGRRERIIDRPIPRVTHTEATRLGTTLYRILKSIHGVEEKKEPGVFDEVAEIGLDAPTFLSVEEHWLSRMNPRAGHTSPAMMFKGRTMLVADVLMNLAYPNGSVYKFGLRRRCKEVRCINPAHYLQAEGRITSCEGGHEIGYTYLTVMMAAEVQKPIPQYRWDVMNSQPFFTGSWKDYLKATEQHWRQAIAQRKEAPQDRTELPTKAEDILKLFNSPEGSESAASVVLNRRK